MEVRGDTCGLSISGTDDRGELGGMSSSEASKEAGSCELTSDGEIMGADVVLELVVAVALDCLTGLRTTEKVLSGLIVRTLLRRVLPSAEESGESGWSL